MLAKPVDQLPQGSALRGGALYEPKWDGYRGLVAVDDRGRGHVRSRRGVDLTMAFSDIAAAAAEQLVPGTVLDGELVVYNGQRLDFAQLQRRVAAPARAAALSRGNPASYVVFDALWVGGRDLTVEPLGVRRRELEALLPGLVPPLQITPATRDRDVALQWLADYTAAGIGIEGLVVKALAEPYLPGRRSWLKLRHRHSVEAIVGAVTATLAAPQRLILGLYDETGRLIVAGATGPLSPAQRREVAAELWPPTGSHPWPTPLPAGRAGGFAGPRLLPVTLVEPAVVVEIEADQAYEYGRWRHLARYRRLRPELHPRGLSPPPGDA
jgi:ATP-dependent DNA ligase